MKFLVPRNFREIAKDIKKLNGGSKSRLAFFGVIYVIIWRKKVESCLSTFFIPPLNPLTYGHIYSLIRHADKAACHLPLCALHIGEGYQ